MNVDLAVLDNFQRLILTVETKKKFGATEKWAAETRQNLVVNGFYPIATFFLLVTPEKFFLWTKENNTFDETIPDFVADATETLKPTLQELGFKIKQISGRAFKDVVSLWLKYDVLYPTKPIKQPKWLLESGLAKKVLHGQLVLADEKAFI